MYLRRLFSDKKIKLIYSNAPKLMNLSCPVNDDSNRTAYKTCLKFWIETQESRLAQKGVVANIADRQLQKFNQKRKKKANIDARIV